MKNSYFTFRFSMVKIGRSYRQSAENLRSLYTRLHLYMQIWRYLQHIASIVGSLHHLRPALVNPSKLLRFLRQLLQRENINENTRMVQQSYTLLYFREFIKIQSSNLMLFFYVYRKFESSGRRSSSAFLLIVAPCQAYVASNDCVSKIHEYR